MAATREKVTRNISGDASATTKPDPRSVTIDPVSYTHLDVYKRQTLYCPYALAHVPGNVLP